MFMALLQPNWPDDRPFEDHLFEWERRVTDYETQTQEEMGERLNVATVMRYAQKHIQQILQHQAYNIGSEYGKMRTLLDAYLQSSRSYVVPPGLPPPTSAQASAQGG